MMKGLPCRLIFALASGAFLILSLVFPAGCKYYNSEDLYPPCDTIHLSYATDLHPIFIANCMPCHSTTNQFAGIILETYEGAIVPARNGLLLKAVTHDPSVVPMPKGGAMLPPCEISIIRQWIAHDEPAKKIR